jgi:endoglucanase
MAARYRDAGNVVGAELRNEIRSEPQLHPGPTAATWGDGHPLTDWRAAAERGGDAVLAENPDLLVIVGGREFQTNLRGAWTHPVRLAQPGRLVYAVHDYRWYHSPIGHYPLFALTLWLRFGWVRTPGHPFTAPLYLSETGTCTNPTGREGCHPDDARFLRHIGRYLARTDIDFAYWPLNGTQGAGYSRRYGAPETYGLLAPDWSGYGNETVLAALRPLQRATKGPGVRRGS